MSDLTVASLGNLSESELIIEGFLARYRGNTLHGYKTDLRMFKRWCDDNELDLLNTTPSGWSPAHAGVRSMPRCAPQSTHTCERSSISTSRPGPTGCATAGIV